MFGIKLPDDYLKAIGFALLIVIYTHYNVYIAELLEADVHFLLFVILIYFATSMVSIRSYFILVIAMVVLLYTHRFAEFFISIPLMIGILALRKLSVSKYDKDLYLVFSQSFVAKFADGRVKVSELDVIYTLLFMTYMMVGENQLLPAESLSKLLGTAIVYGY